MSEEILRALTQLFAIITKQDDGVSESERTFVHNFFRSELDLESTEDYLALYDKFSGYTKHQDKLINRHGLHLSKIQSKHWVCVRRSTRLWNKSKRCSS